MAIYKITDPNTGRSVKLTGETPPTEEQIKGIFSKLNLQPKSQSKPIEEQRFAEPIGLGGKVTRIPLASGEIFPLQAGMQEVQDRGQLDPQTAFQQMIGGETISEKVSGGLGLLADPFRRAEAAIANPMLAMQRGKFSPKEIFEQSILGLKGQQVGELGDVIRSTGLLPEEISSTIGFTGSLIAPLKAARDTFKSIKGVATRSDKKLLKAGEDILTATDESISKIGSAVDKAYEPINEIGVKLDQSVLDDIVNLPKSVIREVEQLAGQSIDDLLAKPNIKNLRNLRGKIAKFKSEAFKETAQDTATNELVNRIYKKLSKSMKSSLEKNTIFDQQTGKFIDLKKEADNLLRADEDFSEASRAAEFLKSSLIEPKLGKPTKAGLVAGRTAKDTDLSTRIALDVIQRKGGKKAVKSLDQAISTFNRFNRSRLLKGGLKAVSRAAILGGAAGAVGSRVFNKIGGD